MSEDPTQVHQLVTALARRHGWTTRAAISRNTGVAETTLARWEDGKGGRGDAFARAEEALALPEGTLGRVLVGELDVDDVLAVRDHQTATDYRSGAGTLDPDEQAGLRALEQRNTAILTVGRSLGRLGLDPVDDPGLDPPADVVVDHDRTRTVIQVAGRLGHDVSQEITDMVGEQARWRADGVDRVIVFAYVDWPERVVEEIGRFGIEYAGSQEQLEQLLNGEPE